jgi:hypothetical protein
LRGLAFNNRKEKYKEFQQNFSGFSRRIEGWTMHTDEYEISLGREIAFCRKMVKKLKDSLARREKQGGMTTEAFLQALEEGRLSEQHPKESWTKEYRELQFWQKTLTEYEKALESLK